MPHDHEYPCTVPGFDFPRSARIGTGAIDTKVFFVFPCSGWVESTVFGCYVLQGRRDSGRSLYRRTLTKNSYDVVTYTNGLFCNLARKLECLKGITSDKK